MAPGLQPGCESSERKFRKRQRGNHRFSQRDANEYGQFQRGNFPRGFDGSKFIVIGWIGRNAVPFAEYYLNGAVFAHDRCVYCGHARDCQRC